MSSVLVKRLVKLAHPVSPIEQPTASDWKHLEDELRLTFPDDFKELVCSLGSGEFGIGFYLRNPKSSSKYAVLSNAALTEYQTLLGVSEQQSGIRLYPKSGGLVVIGGIDRQQFLLQPDKTGFLLNLVWWDLDYEQATEVGTSVAQFIHDLYFGEVYEERVQELRTCIWREPSVPLFTSSKGVTH